MIGGGVVEMKGSSLLCVGGGVVEVEDSSWFRKAVGSSFE
jgi:hypothetical protein